MATLAVIGVENLAPFIVPPCDSLVNSFSIVSNFSHDTQKGLAAVLLLSDDMFKSKLYVTFF